MTKYKDKVIALVRGGNTDEEIAKKLCICRNSLISYRKRNPKFNEEYEAAKVEPNLEIESAVFKRATGYDVIEEHIEYLPSNEGDSKKTKVKVVKRIKKHIPGDTTAQIFWLCNRDPDKWKHRRQTEVTGADGVPLQIILKPE